AIAYEEKALKIAETLADKVHLLTILNNLATNYNYLGNYEHSIRLSRQALTILETYPVEITYFHVISTLVEAYLGTGQYALAQELLQDSFKQLKDRPFKELQQHVLILWGKLHLAQEEPAAAIPYLQQAAEMAEHIGNKHIAADVHLTLSEAYQQAAQWPQALHHYQQFHLYRELMFNAQADQRLKSIEVTYDTAAARQKAAFLESQNEALEQTVNERTQELQSALDRERLLKQELAHALTQEAELSSLKSQIITTVSHEFRTPLTVINTSTNLLYKRFERLSEEKRQELFERVHQSIFYLSDLLQDISLVNIMQNEQVTPSYNDYTFSSLCQHLSSQLAYELGHPPNLVFSYDENLNALIELDFELLKQIVFDLLSNAIKYSEPTEPIEIAFKIDDQCFKISVEDQGIGIPKEELQKIFELFYRGSNVSTRRGMGLGLYIVKHLTDSLQGQVHVASAGDGQGSRFTVQIPLKAQNSA
ncbi:MAG: ATP-binding protein, partial [Anaerolineales bacterium]|nr:ATP-binding protein [Anaerolineales bacterium]